MTTLQNTYLYYNVMLHKPLQQKLNQNSVVTEQYVEYCHGWSVPPAYF